MLHLVVLVGVDRIQGESLNFGGVAATVLKDTKASVLLIATGSAGRKGATKPELLN